MEANYTNLYSKIGLNYTTDAVLVKLKEHKSTSHISMTKTLKLDFEVGCGGDKQRQPLL